MKYYSIKFREKIWTIYVIKNINHAYFIITGEQA